jgi:SAM-dependent methyltransferase
MSGYGAPERILANPYVAGKLLQPVVGDVLVLKHSAAAELPTPPMEFWEGYGADEEHYLEYGRLHYDQMLSLLDAAGAPSSTFGRVLDFGCAAGRILRWFPAGADSELWGTDIKGDTIAWCQQHLSPPMHFATNTTFPHLPFEDGYFDLIYANSVFSHIIDLPDAWFLELRRILRPGGHGFVSVFDKRSLELSLNSDMGAHGWFPQKVRDFDRRTGALSSDFAYFSFDDGPDWNGMPVPQVCYDRDYIVQKWSRLVEIMSVTEEGHGIQTAILFRKATH